MTIHFAFQFFLHTHTESGGEEEKEKKKYGKWELFESFKKTCTACCVIQKSKFTSYGSRKVSAFPYANKRHTSSFTRIASRKRTMRAIEMRANEEINQKGREDARGHIVVTLTGRQVGCVHVSLGLTDAPPMRILIGIIVMSLLINELFRCASFLVKNF